MGKPKASLSTEPHHGNLQLDRQQQSLIIQDLSASRRKLEDDNQMLRQELEDAKIMIRLLKLKIDKKDHPTNRSKGLILLSSFVKKAKKPSSKDVFKNPMAPGRKTFQSP